MKFTRTSFLRWLFLLCLWLNAFSTMAQDLVIELGKNRLPITEYFTISVRVRGVAVQAVGDFPEIEGFQQSNRTRSRSRITAGNRAFIEETITQNYAALQEGTYVLKPFSLQVNGKTIRSKGMTITVGPEPENQPESARKPALAEPLPSREVPAGRSGSFLSLETSRRSVYMGEGVLVQLSFYLAEEEQGLLDFYQFADQFYAISKALKQTQVWEENYEVNAARPDTIVSGNKTYIRFKLYEAMNYPLAARSLEFPAVTLRMLRRAQPMPAGEPAGSSEIVTFQSRPVVVTVQGLPAHPAHETAVVGRYQVREGIDRTRFRTDKGFVYTFSVEGQGNLSALTLPERQLNGLEVYPPQVRLQPDPYRRGSGRKSFRFTLLARAPGKYDLGKLFFLPVFNPASGQYDTLRSELQITVAGPEELASGEKPEETDPFYQAIQTESNQLANLNSFAQVKLYTNLAILFLICASLYVFYKK